MNSPRLCARRKTDGSVCSSPAISDRDFCYHHLPAVPANSDTITVPDFTSPDRIQHFLADIAYALLAGKLDPRRAKCLTYIAQTAAFALRYTTQLPARFRPIDIPISDEDNQIDTDDAMDSDTADSDTVTAAPAAGNGVTIKAVADPAFARSPRYAPIGAPKVEERMAHLPL